MNYTISVKNTEKKYDNCLVFGIFENVNLFGSVKIINDLSNGYIHKLIQKNEITGAINEFLLLNFVPNVCSKKVLIVGCGKEKCFDINSYKKLFTTSINLLKHSSTSIVTFFFSELDIQNIDVYWKIRFAISAIQDNFYSFDNFKTNKSKKKKYLFKHIYLNILSKNDFVSGNNAIKHAVIISRGKKISKDISNMPPNICNPLYLASQAIMLSKSYPESITTEIINHNDMKNLQMNAYLSVGSGSKNKSLMSVIKYTGNSVSNNKKYIVFIGKGVTFDSGGISIKPSSHMDEMKFDMSGAAVVLGLMYIIAELKLPLNIIGILAGTENMIGSQSYRPGDILTTMSGKTVEILNTDAEGRLVLCDVLTYVKRFCPEIVIDIATLTGACVVALGHYVTGLMSNNDDLAEELNIASKQTNDLIWRLPLFKKYYEDLESNIADITNVGKNSAGAITAACFLSKFSKAYKWAHLDIAGTAWNSGKNKGATGRPIELIVQFLLNKLI